MRWTRDGKSDNDDQAELELSAAACRMVCGQSCVVQPCRRGAQWWLHTSIEKTFESPPKIAAQITNAQIRLCTVDLNLGEYLAVCSVQTVEGTILATRFIGGGRAISGFRKKQLGRIARNRAQTGIIAENEQDNADLWRTIRNADEHIAHLVSARIAQFACEQGACILVFEHLGSLRPKKGKYSRKGNSKRAYWMKGRIFTYAKYKAWTHKIITSRINPRNTSRECHRCHAPVIRYAQGHPVEGYTRAARFQPMRSVTCTFVLDTMLIENEKVEKHMALELYHHNGHERQLELFDIEEIAPSAKDAKKTTRTGFSDPAFASNKNLPIHRWVPWIAGFSSEFVGHALDTYLHGKGTVLDPFSGVGTTLLETVLRGHNAIGFEINPYAAMACDVKVHAYRVDVSYLYDEITNFHAFYNAMIVSDYKPHTPLPQGFKTRTDFYSPSVLYKVLLLQDFIQTIVSDEIQALFKLAFAATMVRYSNYSYEPSLGRRVSSGKEAISEFPVAEVVIQKLTEMANDIRWFQQHIQDEQIQAQVIPDSFFNYQTHLAPESIDLIITSPPYLNNYHYNRNTRPHLYWLGYATCPQDLKHLEVSNFGKYWQTVREQAHIDIQFDLPNTDLSERLAALRQLHPEKGIYGGNGWANYAASYFNDCYLLALGIRYVLKPGARALVVIGNSILQGMLIPTDQYFAKIAESVGLELVGIEIPRATRVGNSIIQSTVRVEKAQKSQQLYEAVVELRRK